MDGHRASICLLPEAAADPFAAVGRQWQVWIEALLGGFYAGPEVFHAVVGFGGDGEDLFEAEALLQCDEVAGALVAAEAVDFGSDYGEVAAGGTEPVDELAVAFLRGDVGVDQTDAELEGGADGEIGLNEGGPAGGDGFRNFGVAVAGQVSLDEPGTLAGVEEREEVDGSGAAGGGGDFGGFGADEGVEEAGLADVGAAEEGDFRDVWGGKLLRCHGR